MSRDGSTTSFRVVLAQVLAVMVRNFAGLAFAMNMAFPTVLIPGLSGQDPEEILSLNDEEISWISSITEGCVTIGCLLSGIVVQLVGRKRTMHLATLPLIASWLILNFSNSPLHVNFSLGLSGFIQGAQQASLTLYLPEIAQPNLRGMLASTGMIIGQLGSLIIYLLGVFLKWRDIALVNCALCSANFLLLFFIPETPEWLIMKNRYPEARRNLAWLRGWTSLEEIEPEFQQLLSEKKNNTSGVENVAVQSSALSVNNEFEVSEKKSAIQFITSHLGKFTKKEFLWPFSLVSFAYFLIHFSGTFTTHTYGVEIFATLKVPIEKYTATVLLGLGSIFGAAICVILIRFVGKRVLSLTSTVGSGICIIILGTYTYMQDIKYLSFQNAAVLVNEAPSSNNVDDYAWVPLLCLILSSCISSFGLVPLAWVLTAEVYGKETKSVGSGVSIAVNFMFAFVANKVFLQMVSNLTLPGTFWAYGCVAFLGALVLYFVLPETEGKTLQEISDHFAGVSKLDNKVKK